VNARRTRRADAPRYGPAPRRICGVAETTFSGVPSSCRPDRNARAARRSSAGCMAQPDRGAQRSAASVSDAARFACGSVSRFAHRVDLVGELAVSFALPLATTAPCARQTYGRAFSLSSRIGRPTNQKPAIVAITRAHRGHLPGRGQQDDERLPRINAFTSARLSTARVLRGRRRRSVAATAWKRRASRSLPCARERHLLAAPQEIDRSAPVKHRA